MSNPAGDGGAGDVTNPAQYRLVNGGADNTVQTTTCSVPQGDDQLISIQSAAYVEAAKRTTLAVNNGTALPVQRYRLFVCPTLLDLDDNALNGNRDGTGGDAFVRSFRIREPQSGSTFTVNTLLDEFDNVCGVVHCSVREAVAASNAASGANTIIIHAGFYQLGSVLSVTDSVTIEGAGYNQTSLDGNETSRILSIQAGVTAVLHDLALSRGNADLGGAVYNLGTLTLQHAYIGHSSADNGGAIYNNSGATLTLLDSVVDSNDAQLNGGALYLTSNSATVIRNTTLLQNSADSFGGAIYQAGGALTITNSIFAQNAANAGGIYFAGGTATLNNISVFANVANEQTGGLLIAAGAQVTASNSLFGDNTLPGDTLINCVGTLNSGGYNLFDTLTNCTLAGDNTTNILTQNILVQGNIVQSTFPYTFPLLAGSPAIASGNPAIPGSAANTCELADILQQPRNDGPCDIGAIEEVLLPMVLHVDALHIDGAAVIADNADITRQIPSLAVFFSKPMQNPAGNTDPNDVTNSANFRLIYAGANHLRETQSCATPAGDDSLITLNSVTYEPLQRKATLTMAASLPDGSFTLFVCNTLKSLGNAFLDGNSDGTSGDDFQRRFQYLVPQLGPIFTVNTTADDFDYTCSVSHCSLREALYASLLAWGNKPTVYIPAGTYLITRTSGEYSGAFLTNSTVIVGAGPENTIIDGNGLARVFTIQGNINYAGGLIRNLTIRNGRAADGAGIFTYDDIILINVVMRDNVATGTGGALVGGDRVTLQNSQIINNTAARAGAIYAEDILILKDVIIQGNTTTAARTLVRQNAALFSPNMQIERSVIADNIGDAISFSYASGTSTLVNTTISGNTGAGMVVREFVGYVGGGSITLNYVTLANNAVGIDAGRGEMRFSNSIFTGNTTSCILTATATVISAGYNLFPNDCTLQNDPQTGDLFGVDALLQPLADNGGSTLTRALGTGSPALNSANPEDCPAQDQRNFGRPGGAACDRGAFESNTAQLLTRLESVITSNQTIEPQLLENEIYHNPVTTFSLKFTQMMQDDLGDTQPGDLTNTAHYQLVRVGADNIAQTTTCGALQGDDSAISIQQVRVVYSTYGIFQIEMTLNNAQPLPAGLYRLIVCDELRDVFGQALDGDSNGQAGGDFVRNFGISILPTVDHISYRVVSSQSVTRYETIFPDMLIARPITHISIQFTQPMFLPINRQLPGSIRNPAYYRIVMPGVDGVFQTAQCPTLSGDDVDVPFEILPDTLELTPLAPLWNGSYRLIVCDDLLDAPGQTHLDGDKDGQPGGNYLVSFQVDTAPTVVNINSRQPTPDNNIDEQERVLLSVTDLYLTFSEPMFDPDGSVDPADVTNPANYVLLADGSDVTFPATCALTTGETNLIDQVAYDPATYIVTIGINNALPLPPDFYRLYACQTLHDANGHALRQSLTSQDTADFIRNFQIDAPQIGSVIYVYTVEDEAVGCGQNRCSLREAVIYANSNPDATTIFLREHTEYDLTIEGRDEIEALTGDLNILTDITIATSRDLNSTINIQGRDRIFRVHEGGRLRLLRVDREGGRGGVGIHPRTAAYPFCRIRCPRTGILEARIIFLVFANPPTRRYRR